jgi:hypothetical protein
VKLDKHIKGARIGMTILLITPPALFVLAGLTINSGLSDKQNIARALVYASFFITGATFLLSGVLLFLKRLSKRVAFLGVGVTGLYLLLPISYILTSPEKKLAMTINAQSDRLSSIASSDPESQNLKNILSGKPFYQMKSHEVTNLNQASNLLEMGEHYTASMKKLPPAPEDSPIIMIKLQDNGIALTYYIEKKWAGGKHSTDDKYITLLFDSNENLVDVKRAL